MRARFVSKSEFPQFSWHLWLSADWAALKKELGSLVILRWQKKWKRQPKRRSWRRPSSQCDSMLKVWSWATSVASRTATATAPYSRLMVSAQRTTRSITLARKLHMSTRPRKRSTIPSSEWCGARFVVRMATLVWCEPSSARAFLPRPSGLLAVWCSTPAPSEIFSRVTLLKAALVFDRIFAAQRQKTLERWPVVMYRWREDCIVIIAPFSSFFSTFDTILQVSSSQQYVTGASNKPFYNSRICSIVVCRMIPVIALASWLFQVTWVETQRIILAGRRFNDCITRSAQREVCR